MAYDTSLPAGGPGNFVSPNTAHEADGVEVDFITVDYISDVSGEVTNPRAGYRRIRTVYAGNPEPRC